MFWDQNYVLVRPYALIFSVFFSVVFGSFLFLILFFFFSPFQFLLILLLLSLLILLIVAILRLLILLLFYFKLFVVLQITHIRHSEWFKSLIRSIWINVYTGEV